MTKVKYDEYGDTKIENIDENGDIIMSLSKARNILHGKKLNYWDLYHEKYINHSDKVIAEYNTAEMYELEAEDYGYDYNNQEIKALKTLGKYHFEKGTKLKELE